MATPRQFSRDEVEIACRSAARRLGYDNVRDLQLQVITGVLSGFDVFGILPTGYGKSLCYASLPWAFDNLYQPDNSSVVCVVTPLTAIIQDQVCFKWSYIVLNQSVTILYTCVQVTSFTSKGLASVGITGNTEKTVLSEVMSGKHQLLFFTPEAILGHNHGRWSNFFRNECAERIRAFVVDEAHTVSMW